METAWNSRRRREDKSKHENAFTYFLVSFHLCPSKPQNANLMNAFKPQRELRRTICDRSEEGTKYSSPVREMYSIIFSFSFSYLSNHSIFWYYFLCCPCCIVSLAITWLGQKKDNTTRYNFVFFGSHLIGDTWDQFPIKIVCIPYNCHLPNTLEFLKWSHKINSFNQYNLRDK